MTSRIKTPEEVASETKAELIKHGLEPISKVEVEDPLTGEKRIISLDRTGHNESKLIQALADPNTPRDRKDFALSMYLYERGAQGASMIADLMRYKGEHTKETRVFKSQIRFDFEMFVQSFASYLDRQERLIGLTLAVDIMKEREGFKEWLKLPNNTGKGYSYIDYACSKVEEITDGVRIAACLVEMAIQAKEEADILRKNMRNLAEARMREKGKGVYVSRAGVPYTIDDPQLNEAVKADRESTAEAKKDI